MSRQHLQALLAQAEQRPELRHRLRLQGSWEQWLEQAQAQGFEVTAADLQQAQVEERQGRLFEQSQLQPIRPLR